MNSDWVNINIRCVAKKICRGPRWERPPPRQSCRLEAHSICRRSGTIMPSMSAGNRVIGVSMEYVNVLDEGQDLVEAAKNLAPPSFRDAEIAAVVEALAKRRLVLLIGPPGVGKTSVLHGVAHRFGDEEGMRLRRFTTAQ